MSSDAVVATSSANGRCHYESIYRGRPLKYWISEVHQRNCKANGWPVTPLKEGAFGYDNLALSLHYLFTLLSEHPQATEEQRAAAIHDGWCCNYLYWRKRQPWVTLAGIYRKPASPLGDQRRDMCARTSFNDLPDDERAKDLLIDRFVRELDGK